MHYYYGFPNKKTKTIFIIESESCQATTEYKVKDMGIECAMTGLCWFASELSIDKLDKIIVLPHLFKYMRNGWEVVILNGD